MGYGRAYFTGAYGQTPPRGAGASPARGLTGWRSADAAHADAKQPSAAEAKLEIASVLTPAEVATLFKLFMDRVNPYMSMFDEALHTLPALRARSPFLLTVSAYKLTKKRRRRGS